MRRRVAWLAGLVLLIALAPDARAYLKLGFTLNGKQISVRWNRMPIKYFVTNRDVAGVSAA